MWAWLAICKESNGHIFLDERKRLNVDRTQLVGIARVVCFITRWYEARETSIY